MPSEMRRPMMGRRMHRFGPTMMGMGGPCPMCGGTGMAHRRYLSEQEEKEYLQDYLSDLQAEVEGVRRRIQELGGAATT
ncbi:MAG: hypothetical protein ACM309_09235 [Bacillota bacterium]